MGCLLTNSLDTRHPLQRMMLNNHKDMQCTQHRSPFSPESSLLISNSPAQVDWVKNAGNQRVSPKLCLLCIATRPEGRLWNTSGGANLKRRFSQHSPFSSDSRWLFFSRPKGPSFPAPITAHYTHNQALRAFNTSIRPGEGL